MSRGLDEAERNRQQREHALTMACMREHRAWWWVYQRNGNASAFSGYHWTPSDYSGVTCSHPRCGRRWRTKAAYVAALPDSEPAVPRYYAEALAAVGEHFPGLDPDASHHRAWGIAQDYERRGAEGRPTTASMDAYVAQLAEWAQRGEPG